MEIKTKSPEEAAALVIALQRLSQTPIEPGKIPMPVGSAFTQTTQLLVEACLKTNPFMKLLADGIVDGSITQYVKPKKVIKKAKRKSPKKKLKARREGSRR